MVVLGLSGFTCSGKTTIAHQLENLFPCTKILGQDSYFLPEDDSRHTWIPSLGHANWEISSSLDMERMKFDAKDIVREKKQDGLVVLEGFLILNDEVLSSLCQIKLFVDLPYHVCKERRNQRTYDPPDPPGYFEQVVWPAAETSRREALELNPDITLLDGTKPISTLMDQVQNILIKHGLTPSAANLSDKTDKC